MAIVVIRNDARTPEWVQILQQQAPEIPVYGYSDTLPWEDIKMAAVWKHPSGSTQRFPNLMGIHGLGAGVDFILEDPRVRTDLPIMRVVDPYLASDMAEYVLAQLLSHIRQLPQYASDKTLFRWAPAPYLRMADFRVGIMGLGELGRAVAKTLVRAGFPVSGWSRTPKPEMGYPVFHGEGARNEFLSGCDALVCLLPLTERTRGILNAAVFNALPKGSLVINVARGPLLNDTDLLAAIASGQVAAACLDVFHTEPLPGNHPFWEHPAVRITPHVASVSDPASVAAQVMVNYKALVAGLPLNNVVDRNRGY